MVVATDAHLERVRDTACRGQPKWLKSLLEDPLGHSFWFYQSKGRQGVVACSKCGAWAALSPLKLKRPCLGGFSDSGRRDWAKLISGQHPHSKLWSVEAGIPLG
eukprot:15469657-Alexandrium_andersonii.AAC.1